MSGKATISALLALCDRRRPFCLSDSCLHAGSCTWLWSLCSYDRRRLHQPSHVEQSPPQEGTLAPQPTRSAGSTSVRGQVASRVAHGMWCPLETGPSCSQSTNASVHLCRDWCGVGPIVLGMEAGCLQVLLLVFALGHSPQSLLRLYCIVLLSETIERTQLPLHCAPSVFPCSLCLPCLSFGGWLLSLFGYIWWALGA